MRIIIYIFLCFFTNQLIAQDPGCAGNRYLDDVFTNVQVTKDLQYGANTTYGGNAIDLFLDIYEPMGDVAEQRAAVIVAFGGSFISGSRADVADVCEAMAKKGYVAVAIDYRIYDGPFFPLPTGDQITEVVIQSIGDVKAAIRYLREDADTDNLYKIDPELIFAGGVSAGAIATAHTAVLDSTDNIPMMLRDMVANQGGFRGNSSSNYQYADDVAGFINFSGALSDASFIDADDPPFYSAHDEFDPTVPYNTGMARVLTFDIVYVEGSLAMSERADSVGVNNQLRTIEGSMEHVGFLYGPNQQFDNIINEAAGFLQEIICGATTSTRIAELPGVQVFPNPVQDRLFIQNKKALNLDINLYNALGQLSGTWQNPVSLDLSHLQPGIYFLELRDDSQQISQIEKISVQ